MFGLPKMFLERKYYLLNCDISCVPELNKSSSQFISCNRVMFLLVYLGFDILRNLNRWFSRMFVGDLFKINRLIFLFKWRLTHFYSIKLCYLSRVGGLPGSINILALSIDVIEIIFFHHVAHICWVRLSW